MWNDKTSHACIANWMEQNGYSLELLLVFLAYPVRSQIVAAAKAWRTELHENRNERQENQKNIEWPTRKGCLESL